MTNVSMLQQLSHAKESHLLWIKKANYLISGSANDKEFIPFDSTECGLGVWLKIEGKKLYHIHTFRRLLDKIEEQHSRLHNIYLNIYQISFIIPKQKSFLQKFFHLNCKIENQEVKEAAQLHKIDIQQSSETLLQLLEILEQKIKAFASEKIEIHSHIRTLQTAS
jgi:hypothetical protein